jgi:hypothetical protein
MPFGNGRAAVDSRRLPRKANKKTRAGLWSIE